MIFGPWKGITLVIATLMFAPFNAGADVFKCKGNDGKLRFQQQPCPSQAEETRIDSGEHDWVLIETKRKSEGYFKKAYMNGRIESIGPLKRAAFWSTYVSEPDEHPNFSKMNRKNIVHYYYDCRSGMISGQYNFNHPHVDEKSLHDRLLGPDGAKDFDPPKYSGRAGNPQAMKRVCGSN